MIQKIKTFILEKQMIQRGDRLLAGVSGGADSVCLLRTLCALQEELGFSLEVVHVEHGIRGTDSIRDAEFVEELCRKLAVPFFLYPVKVPEYAKEHHLGTEEAARILRYQAFEHRASQGGSGIIALAHHIDDNAETILFQLARGSGLAGLCGMSPVRRVPGLCYIRPLLCVSRKEIEEFLEKEGQNYCADLTNQENDYSRNRIRNCILPELEKINSRAACHMNETALLLREVQDYVQQEAQKAQKTCVHKTNQGFELDGTLLRTMPAALQKEVVRNVVFAASGQKKDITSTHVRDILYLLNAQSGRRIMLPYGLCVQKEFERIIITNYGKDDKKDDRGAGKCYDGPDGKSAGKRYDGPDGKSAGKRCEEQDGKADEKWNGKQGICMEVSGAFLKGLPLSKDSGQSMDFHQNKQFLVSQEGVWGFRIFPYEKNLLQIPKKPYTKWFDYDMIKQGFSVRKRRQGDYFFSDEQGHRKKLKQYMIDEKIPLSERNSVLLLAEDSHVLWVVGYRMCHACRVTDATRLVLEIEYRRITDDKA